MKSKLLLLLIYFFTVLNANAQVSGNSVLNNNQNYGSAKNTSAERLMLTDSTFIIEANILLNVVADNYVAVFGVSESANTIKECNEKIEIRIQNFISELSKIGINKKDIYVDMTTQTKIYDYKIEGSFAEQFLQGFEIKKNVIVKFSSIKDLDNMLIAASNYEIYDLVKVDYNVSGIDTMHAALFEKATEVIQNKKNLYAKATNAKLAPSSQIYGESFYSITPDQQYKSYTSNESTAYRDNSNYSKRKELMKTPTYYYDKMNYSGFDKIINPIVTEPVVEFVLSLQIKFQILK